ncbi:MAG: DUF4282 domain-containing protein [Spirochaetales bacterium]|nr:DUF4282 domain-containing protein [Spirochaetales bacterium]
MNIFKFDSFIVPKLLTVLYNIILIVSVGVGLFRVFTGISDGMEANDFQSQIPTILIGLGITILIPLAARVFTEMTLILFKIEENTRRKSVK